MGLQSGLLHLILKCDAQQQEQRTQNTHAAQRGLGELAVPLFMYFVIYSSGISLSFWLSSSDSSTVLILAKK